MLCVPARLGVVALLGLCRPEQRERLQWPVRLHLCDGGAIKAPDGGGYGARMASADAPASLTTRSPQRAAWAAALCSFPRWKPLFFIC